MPGNGGGAPRNTRNSSGPFLYSSQWENNNVPPGKPNGGGKL